MNVTLILPHYEVSVGHADDWTLPMLATCNHLHTVTISLCLHGYFDVEDRSSGGREQLLLRFIKSTPKTLRKLSIQLETSMWTLDEHTLDASRVQWSSIGKHIQDMTQIRRVTISLTGMFEEEPHVQISTVVVDLIASGFPRFKYRLSKHVHIDHGQD